MHRNDLKEGCVRRRGRAREMLSCLRGNRQTRLMGAVVLGLKLQRSHDQKICVCCWILEFQALEKGEAGGGQGS